MKINLYANMGERAHEYNPVYAYVAGECSDPVVVDIPVRYSPAELSSGTYSVTVPINGEMCEMDAAEALTHYAQFRKACTIKML